MENQLNNETIKSILDSKNVILVHFSHLAKMRPNGIFPNDLQDAIQNVDSWTLSCCAILPNRPMVFPGMVGIILDIQDSTEIVSVSKEDSGSTTLPDGTEQSGGVICTAESICESLSYSESSYNEWRIKCASVRGLFIVDPQNIQAKKQQILEIGEGEKKAFIGMQTIQLDEVRCAFPNYCIYTFKDGTLTPVP